jgi:hypothetical protein
LLTNEKVSATLVGILAQPHESHSRHRYIKTNRVLQTHKSFPLRPDRVVQHPHGTSHQSALFELGHPGHHLDLPTQVTSMMMRDLRSALFQARKKRGTIHVFGILDTESPHGSLSLLESIIRFLLPSGHPLSIHAGAWSPTPREFRMSYQSLQSIATRPTVNVSSVFPFTALQHEQSAQLFIDGLHYIDHSEPVNFPLQVQTRLSSEGLKDNDIFIIPYSPSREAFNLTHALHSRFPEQDCIQLKHYVPSQRAVAQTLSKSKHILALATHPSYIEAYFGSDLNHPYFESMVVHSPKELLQMLISPHFGYTAPPHLTSVFLDESKDPEFDWLLASYLRKIMTTPFYVSWITENSLKDDIVYSNDHNYETVLEPEAMNWHG